MPLRGTREEGKITANDTLSTYARVLSTLGILSWKVHFELVELNYNNIRKYIKHLKRGQIARSRNNKNKM